MLMLMSERVKAAEGRREEVALAIERCPWGEGGEREREKKKIEKGSYKHIIWRDKGKGEWSGDKGWRDKRKGGREES
jgi:hypothetical protein